MGRRSINTTKSGKYMNPTDQARKEARKKELKKNKKQRQLVRAAVLKNKDPSQILDEMEKIDEMEYNVLQPSPLNEKVLRDKRKKLKETFDRVMRLYHNDDPEHWAELKRKEMEYEKKRLKKQQYYESVKHAQSVQIDEIPLPSSNQLPAVVTPTAPVGSLGPKRLPPPPAALSLPPFAPSAPPGTLKKTNENVTKNTENMDEKKKKDTLGVPVGPSPNLMEMPDLDTDAEDDEVVLKKYIPKAKVVPKPNSLQQRILAISGQNIDEFMKEMESVHKKKEQEAAAISTKETTISANDNTENSEKKNAENFNEHNEKEINVNANVHSSTNIEQTLATGSNSSGSVNGHGHLSTRAIPSQINLPPHPSANAQNHIIIPGPPSIATPLQPIATLAPPMIFRPPLPRPPTIQGYNMRMPPCPPPGPRPLPPNLSGGLSRGLGIRIPGPPPGLPPRTQHHHKNMQQSKDSKGVTTISAKPQIRNLSADVTRFVPSTLRIKREDIRKSQRPRPYSNDNLNTTMENNKASKDDAYLQFMNEMQGLL